jgi:hypothetical protein
MKHCPNCRGGELAIVMAILGRPVMEKIITHLGLQAQSLPRARAREVAFRTALEGECVRVSTLVGEARSWIASVTCTRNAAGRPRCGAGPAVGLAQSSGPGGPGRLRLQPQPKTPAVAATLPPRCRQPCSRAGMPGFAARTDRARQVRIEPGQRMADVGGEVGKRPGW